MQKASRLSVSALSTRNRRSENASNKPRNDDIASRLQSAFCIELLAGVARDCDFGVKMWLLRLYRLDMHRWRPRTAELTDDALTAKSDLTARMGPRARLLTHKS
jgi:hypothetical protein